MSYFAYKWLFQINTGDLLHKYLPNLLETFGYYGIIKGEDFVYAKGESPILLTAHVDTVHKVLPETIFCDDTAKVIWSPSGLGADDRAGVAAILEILRRGHRPHILFTDKEEVGGVGAIEAAKSIRPNVSYVIGLDRKGSNDAVFYDCENAEFIDYILSFGFEFSLGSFSDISFVCPAWKIAGVNLSVGYYNNHSVSEYLNFREWLATVDKVCLMIEKVPDEKFEYIATLKRQNNLAYYQFYNEDQLDDGLLLLDDFSTEIMVFVSPEDLVREFGGSVDDWIEYINYRGIDLEDITYSFITNLIREDAGIFMDS